MKCMRFIMAAVVAGLLLASFGAPRSARGADPIAHWEFDEGSGAAVHDSVGGFHGTQSHCTWNGDGVCGKAFVIPADGDNSGIVSGISANFDDSITSAFSVTCWLRWDGTHTGNTRSPYSYILDARDYANREERGGFILMILDNGHVALDLLAPRRRLESRHEVPTGDWCHVAAVYDDGIARLYINGVPDRETTFATTAYTKTGLGAAIGNNRWAPDDQQHAPLNGRIDDLRVYGVALTPLQILPVIAECLVHLDLVIVGNGSVSVTGGVSTDSLLFVVGTDATITAHTAFGEWLIRWEGDAGISVDSTATVHMDANKRVIVVFTAFGLSLSYEGTGAGAVDVSYPSGYPVGCTRFAPGDVATLTPSAEGGSHFCAWGGDTPAHASPLDLPMTGDRSVSALFCPDTHRGLVTRPIGNGAISRTLDSTCYLVGSPVTLHATPTSPWLFREWGGDVTTAADDDATVVMDDDKVVTARFGGYVLDVTTNGPGCVRRAVNATEYAPGSSETLRAFPETEAVLVTWSGNASGSADSVVVTMDGDKSVTATFAILTSDAPASRARLLLAPATPNPSSRASTLRFELSRASRVTLAIHDVAGRVVRVALAGAVRSAGPHAWSWDGRDGEGRAVRPGLYFARLATDDGTLTGRIVRLE